MAIALTLQKYLAAKGIRYDLVTHNPTRSSMKTAEACHVPGDRVAKGVLLRDQTGYALAVLPASHHIRFSALRSQVGDDVRLASEYEAAELFEDCTRGAFPAVGDCYGLDMIVDDSIEEQPEVYFEAGDHATLIHMSHAQFATLTATARHGRFSVRDTDVYG
jgi:Ala-tRNA(Pro) deacylase